MANQGRRRNPGDDMDETRVYRGGFVPDQNGYYESGQDYGYDQGYGQSYDPGYDPGYEQYDPGYDDGYGQYDDGYGQGYDPGYRQYESYDPGYEQGYDGGYGRGMSMAARAAGKANPDPYSDPYGGTRRRGPSGGYSYEEVYREPRQRPRRRKKRHGLRNFFVFLLVLAAIIGVCYALLFRAPEQYQDGVHTRKAGFFNILIAATDADGTRTDTMIMASMDTKAGTVSLTSLPRDTIVDNGQAVPKLNGVFGLGGGGETGMETLMDEIKTLLGFRPDGYVLVDYEIFRDVVDALGGVSFEVPMDMNVDNPDTGEEMLISQGQQVLDGDQALGVCRYREGYLMADIQRQYVQQSFLKAVIKSCASPKNLLKLPSVYSAATDHMTTNLSGANLRYLGLKALLGGLGDMEQNTLPGEGVDYNGASCYGLYGQSVVNMVNEVMNPFEEDLTIDDVHILTVYGGYLVESTWEGTAFDASAYQYN